jgi:hypothetical protein
MEWNLPFELQIHFKEGFTPSKTLIGRSVTSEEMESVYMFSKFQEWTHFQIVEQNKYSFSFTVLFIKSSFRQNQREKI